MTDQAQPVKRRRGCLFYVLCGGILILAILSGLLLGSLQVLRIFTEVKPASFPPVKITATEMEQLRQRADIFRDNVRAARPTEPLSLTANEINALIANYSDLQVLKGRLYVTDLQSNQIKGLVSVPTSQVPVGAFKFLKNRYVNGSATLDLSFTNGTLNLNLQKLAVKGKELPEKYMQAIHARNFAQKINNDPRLSAGLNKLQSIEIKDSKLVIVPAPPPQ